MRVPAIINQLTKAEIVELPIRLYEGPVHLVVTPHDLDRARHEFRRERVVGLDTETRPAFRKGESHLPSLAQVATSHAVYLLPLKQLDCADVLTELLENPGIVKAGIGLRDDFVKLRMRFPFEEKNVVDLSAVAKRHGMERPSVRHLAGSFLGFRIPKGQSTSNWGRAELTRKQIVYAATDAWVCRELYLCFRERGFQEEMKEKFLKGIELFNRGLYFEAHEIWEEAWNESEGAEKRCLQALIQIAVALLKWRSGIPGGALKMYRSACEKLALLPDRCLGLDLRAVERDFKALLGKLDGNAGEPFPQDIFQIRAE